ncbi:non-ribosomal peptide synthetase [Acaryochloris sp. IP29b_bin.148]|uniref:non-ribosomal peptide synthetase n=1 Tax=Acaryochloris sp. IP29b_bin.148 TaxID=2969218 RepID=UPI00261782D8|nr:non-ribosomal peptide synthetase [Acaryochloris sp. IP29b_bin.148]
MSDFLDHIKTLSPKRLALLAYELHEELEALKQSEPIAIIGMGCRFPGGVNDPDAYWQLLQSGQDPITEVPPERWDVEDYFNSDPSVSGKTYTRYGGFIDNVDQFDPSFFGISPREATAMDPQQRLLLEVSWEALERAGHVPQQNNQTGVFVAIGTADYANLQAGSPTGIDAYTGTGSGFCFAAGRLSYVLGLQGPNMALDAACSSSLMAVHLGCQSLRNRECDQVLAGGVNLILSPESNIAYAATRMMAVDGHCKTFDASADGYVRSEGCAVVVLKRLKDALVNNDNVLAVIKGSACNHGGASGGLTIPNGAAQQTVVRAALAQANVSASAVQYVEAQGTGTPLGDTIEVRALTQVFKEGRSPQSPLYLASVKTNIGHTETASGMASLLKVVLCLQHQQLPPHLHLKSLNPEINLDQIPARIPTQLTPWPAGPQLAGINSFGMSGTNAHAVLEAAPSVSQTTSQITSTLALLPLSAKTPAALKELVQRYLKFLQVYPQVELANLCFTAGVGRSHFQYRYAFVADSVSELQKALARYLESDRQPQSVSPVAGRDTSSLETDSDLLHCPPILGGECPETESFTTSAQGALELIFFFPSEQRQTLDWGPTLYQTYSVFRATVDEAKKILSVLGVEAAASPDPNVDHFVWRYALAQLWQSWGIQPTGVMGCRAIAACYAGYFTLESALQWLVNGTPIQLQPPTTLLYGDTPQQLVDAATVSSWIKTPEEPALKPLQGPEQYLILGEPGWGTSHYWTAAARPDAIVQSLAQLYQRGYGIDWQGVYHGCQLQRIALPTYPFQRQRYWSDWASVQLQPSSRNASETGQSLQDLRPLEPEQRHTVLVEDLRARFAHALGIRLNQLTATTPLQDLALDSMMATEIKFDLEKQLGYSVPLIEFLNSPTIAVLATQILVNLDQPIAVLPELTLAPSDRHQPFPLNEIQTAYWIGRSGAFEMGNVAAHVYAEFAGQDLDCHRLQQAFQKVIDRHPVLRTVVLPDGKQQVLADLPPYEMSCLDWRGLNPEVEVQQLRDRMSHQMLDPHCWPLFEVCVARVDQQSVRIFLSIDNLLVDGASLGIICREWGQFYTDLETALPSLDLTFRDYVLTLQFFEASERYQQSRAYWQDRLDHLPPGPALPATPSHITRPRFVRHTQRLAAQQWQALKDQASGLGLTPSGLLLAAYTEVLATWSQSRQFCVNLTTFNRLPLHPQVQDLVGDFTALTLLAVDYRQSAPFADRARQLQQQLWQDLEHSLVSGVSVLREMMAQRQEQVSMPVVFTSLLANPQLQERSTFNTDWLGDLVHSIAQTPQVWLDHQVYEEAGELVYNWDVVEGLFPPGMIEAMFSAYHQLLVTLATHPQQWQNHHPLPLAEPSVPFTEASLPTDLLQDGLTSQAQRQPQHLAVITPELTLTYGELCQRAQQVGQRLRRLGVKPQELVAISMEKGWEQVVAVYGVLMAGAAYVPIDPTLPLERRYHLVEAGNIHWVLNQRRLVDAIAWPVQVQMIPVDAPDLLQEYDAPLPSQQQPTDLAYVIYTSGSTGIPKGVMIDHQGAMNTIADINQRFQVQPQDRVLALSSLSFDLSVYDIFGTLSAGGTLVIPADRDRKEPAAWVQLIDDHQITIWNSVPALMQMLINHGAPAESLRLILLSGDWIPLGLPHQIWNTCPQAQLMSLGGATEASIWSILYPVDAVDPSWRSIPYGYPMTNQRFYVLNEQLNPCPVGVPGQLYIGGVGLAQGYWQDPEKTDASFLTHPVSGERLYRTGDLGCYQPEGYIEFLGRNDQQIQLRGYRIELGEIETVLEEHPEVQQAVVTVMGATGHNQQLGALVVPSFIAPDTAKVMPASSLSTEDDAWNDLVEASRVCAQASVDSSDLQCFKSFSHHLHQLYTQGMSVALHRLEVFPSTGLGLTVVELLERGSIHPRYQSWLQRACDQLVSQGWCQQQGQSFTLLRPLPTTLDAQLISQVREQAPVAMALTPAMITLLLQIVENLPDLLTEQQHSAEIYVGQDIPEVYQTQFDSCNTLMAKVVAHLAHLQPSKQLRMLEVGAGLGSTTQHILPLLSATSHISYHFTDISTYFLQRAKQQFSAYPFLTTGLLDLEQSPEAQGYERHSFDVIIASSVLHATRNVNETLTHLRQMLSPGGVLLFLEETQFHPAFDLTMGLQQGFDRRQDLDLRPSHPLLSPQQWQQCLQANDFLHSQILSQPNTLADWLGFEVFVAQGPLSVRTFQPQVLQAFLAQKLPDYMVPSSLKTLETLPLTANGKINRRAVESLWPQAARPAGQMIAPRNALEEAIVQIWAQVLDTPHLGVENSFFEQGGDSLLATQVIARVRETFGVDISLRALFQEPTVAALAQEVAQALAAQVDSDLLAAIESDPIITEGTER